jgi:imidazolonepropionase-like amidohydrolase
VGSGTGEHGWLHRCGALRAVTSVAADACQVGDRKGRIAPGYDSDLLAVAGDPLTDANAVREVVAVFRAGHRVR